MTVIKRKTDYALWCLAYMADFPKERVFSLRLLGQKREASTIFLRKIFQILAKKKIVDSHRGISGGFSLSRDPSEIFVKEIIDVVQGPIVFNECLTGDYHCTKEKTCILRHYLAGIQKELNQKFRSLSLKHLSDQKN